MEGIYIKLYEDELIDDISLFDEKEVASACEALRGFHANINLAGIFHPGYFQPSDLPEVPNKEFDTIFRECAGRRAAISVDTSDMGPTQMAAYNLFTSWAGNTGS